MNFSLKNRVASFGHALRGLKYLLQTQHNAWIHLVATLVAITLGAILSISKTDWALIIIAIVMVWTSEALNTAIEFLADAITNEQHPLIGKAKDLAAAAVLLAAFGATLIGLLVFLPHLLS